ncbi:MAG: ANTAR domain-containing protein [Gaiellaceae bacterium]
MPFPSSTGLRPKRICRNGAKGAVANTFDGVDARALPAQIAAEMDRLVVYADAQERKVSQLQSALDSRVVIEQAIGILAERFDLPFADAFEMLRAAARNSRREVRAVAEELRASRETPLAISDVLPRDADRLLSSDVELAEEDLRCPRCGTLVTY